MHACFSVSCDASIGYKKISGSLLSLLINLVMNCYRVILEAMAMLLKRDIVRMMMI